MLRLGIAGGQFRGCTLPRYVSTSFVGLLQRIDRVVDHASHGSGERCFIIDCDQLGLQLDSGRIDTGFTGADWVEVVPHARVLLCL